MIYNSNSKNPLKPSDFRLFKNEEEVTSQLSNENNNLHLQLMAKSKERIHSK